MAARTTHEDSAVWMEGSYSADDLILKRAVVRERFSRPTETTIEFKSTSKNIKLEDIVGQTMSVVVETEGDGQKWFTGICVSVENLGFRDGFGQFVAQVRPWLWMLTRTRNNRIFQNMDAVEIIEKVFKDHGFTDYTKKLTESREKRDYCVQYRESDFDFISRLMEEDGIYYFFDNGTARNSLEKLVLCDGVGAHKPMPEKTDLEYYPRHESLGKRKDAVGEWSADEGLTSGKVTLNDFDFLSPTADLKVTKAIEKGKHSYKKFEIYDYPGHYRKNTGLGTTQARIRMEAEAIRHKRWRGAANVRTLSTGYTFKLADHPDVQASDEFIVTDATHYLQHSADFDDTQRRRDLKGEMPDFPEEMESDLYACTFGAIPKREQYRAPLETPWPEISGLHTATVVGKSGEEIWTDEHGRIKVQFHWDREGRKDENSSCWVRVVTPWSGKGWGMVALPRMGQEVVIQFEEGDPDRPICTGMLYNADTKPAFKYPDNATELGIRTNSSKGGGGYNELMFDDKKDAELMRVQAQKDHRFLIKDSSAVTIGLDAAVEPGADDKEHSLTETVKKNVTKTIQEGNHTFTIQKGDETFAIETGSQTISIKTDKTQTIEGKHTKTITGNDSTTVKTGNMTVDVKSGKITMTAMQSIELKVGGSSIKLDPSGVTIKGLMIKVFADGMAEMKSPLTTVKGDGMLTLKGGVTLIN